MWAEFGLWYSQVRAIVDRLSDLIQVLQSPPAMPAIINSTGKLDPPLGSIRMKSVNLLHALVLTGDAVVEEKIIESKAMSVVMDLFFKYEWCNILHNTVKAMIDGILAGDKSNMKKCLIVDCNLLARIITAHQPEKPNGKVMAIATPPAHSTPHARARALSACGPCASARGIRLI